MWEKSSECHLNSGASHHNCTAYTCLLAEQGGEKKTVYGFSNVSLSVSVCSCQTRLDLAAKWEVSAYFSQQKVVIG